MAKWGHSYILLLFSNPCDLPMRNMAPSNDYWLRLCTASWKMMPHAWGPSSLSSLFSCIFRCLYEAGSLWVKWYVMGPVDSKSMDSLLQLFAVQWAPSNELPRGTPCCWVHPYSPPLATLFTCSPCWQWSGQCQRLADLHWLSHSVHLVVLCLFHREHSLSKTKSFTLCAYFICLLTCIYPDLLVLGLPILLLPDPTVSRKSIPIADELCVSDNCMYVTEDTYYVGALLFPQKVDNKVTAQTCGHWEDFTLIAIIQGHQTYHFSPLSTRWVICESHTYTAMSVSCRRGTGATVLNGMSPFLIQLT